MRVGLSSTSNNFFICEDEKENYPEQVNEMLETIIFKRKENPGPVSPRSLKTRKVKQNFTQRELFKPKLNEMELANTWLTEQPDSNDELLVSWLSFKEMEQEKNQINSSEEIKKTREFYKEKWPEKWIPIGFNNKIVINIPKTCASTRNLIYIFRNKKNGMLLIGKTSTTFSKRMNIYKTAFKNTNKIPKKINEKGFVAAVQANPIDFEVGILYILEKGEDLNQMETLFIDYKSEEHPLYNQRRGGAGGLARNEEKPTTYVIPKEGPFSPPKYYPLHEDSEGRIRPDFSPGFYKHFSALKESRKDESQGFLYSIKNLETGQKYQGGSFQETPKRPLQHCYQAEKFNPNNKDKYNPELKEGIIHREMGKNPGNFGLNFLPVLYDVSNIPEEERKNYHVAKSLGEAEVLSIKINSALVAQGGFNCNRGGGGPIADPKKNRRYSY